MTVMRLRESYTYAPRDDGISLPPAEAFRTILPGRVDVEMLTKQLGTPKVERLIERGLLIPEPQDG